MASIDSPLMNGWKDLKLTEDEEKIVDCSNTSASDFSAQASLALVGKVMTEKPFRGPGLFTFLHKAWKLKKNFGAREVGENLYIFQFFAQEDKSRVLQGGPWIFDKQRILLAEVEASIAPSEVQFIHVNFWVRGHDIPFGNTSKEMARALAAHFVGGLVEYREVDKLGWSRYMAFRVKVNIHEPLLRGTIASFGDAGVKWIPFKYKRLPNFRYRCGRIGHMASNGSSRLSQLGSLDHLC